MPRSKHPRAKYRRSLRGRNPHDQAQYQYGMRAADLKGTRAERFALIRAHVAACKSATGSQGAIRERREAAL
jgi:hypothetical protein